MSKTSEKDHIIFLISCTKHCNGRIDFAEVAKETGVVSKGAAAKRYERLCKSYGVSGNDNTRDTPPPRTSRRPSSSLRAAKKRAFREKTSSADTGTITASGPSGQRGSETNTGVSGTELRNSQHTGMAADNMAYLDPAAPRFGPLPPPTAIPTRDQTNPNLSGRFRPSSTAPFGAPFLMPGPGAGFQPPQGMHFQPVFAPTRFGPAPPIPVDLQGHPFFDRHLPPVAVAAGIRQAFPAHSDVLESGPEYITRPVQLPVDPDLLNQNLSLQQPPGYQADMELTDLIGRMPLRLPLPAQEVVPISQTEATSNSTDVNVNDPNNGVVVVD